MVIFYAGLGNYDEVSEKEYWMPSDAKMEFEGNVINNTTGKNNPQYAPISRTGDEGGDFIFIKRQ